LTLVGARTAIWTSGVKLRATWPAWTTGVDVTFPRSPAGLMPAAPAAALVAASLRMISLTVLGFVWRLWICPPPDGVKGWPR
jgi:hypothetical protein